MSYVYRKTGSKVWYIGYKDARGRQVRAATKAATKAEAQRIADDLERKAERVRLGIEASPQKQIEWTQTVDKYLTEEAPKLAAFASVKASIRRHVREAFAGKMLAEITEGDVGAFDTTRLESGLAPGTREQIRLRISAIFEFAKSNRLASANPASEYGKITIPEQPIQHFEPNQVPLLVSEIAAHWRLPAAIAVMCGLRKGEVAGLTVEQLDFDGRAIVIDRQYEGQATKTKRPRTVPMPEMIVPALAEACDALGAGRLFPWMSKNSDAASVVRNAARRAGLPLLDFKALRATWGTISYEATGDIRYVQKGLGHSTSKVTEKSYANFRAKRALTVANEVASHPGLTALPDVFKKKGRSTVFPHTSAPVLRRPLRTAGTPRQISSGVLPVVVGSGGVRPGADVVDAQNPSVLPGSAASTHPQLTAELPLTVREAAQILSVSEDTVRRLITSGRIAVIRRAGHVRIHPSALRALRHP